MAFELQERRNAHPVANTRISVFLSVPHILENIIHALWILEAESAQGGLGEGYTKEEVLVQRRNIFTLYVPFLTVAWGWREPQLAEVILPNSGSVTPTIWLGDTMLFRGGRVESKNVQVAAKGW